MVGYTLVSIGHLDQLGYSVTFADGPCTICSPDDNVIGCVPKTQAGLYCVIHTGTHEEAIATTETVTIMELHRRLGHILPTVAHHLAENGLVSGLKFDLSEDKPTFCEACVYVKATSISKTDPLCPDLYRPQTHRQVPLCTDLPLTVSVYRFPPLNLTCRS
ncbi:hypothetical protein PISMIDRAFT_119245 [Pisolithus microcarpus 441]|uniref:GAG-pre-integrase domain-containing protein n=1 Tax=Pisolithus microcarpus 441 TaxID=765257 RepID=A0A0C9YZD6_9AGAM|nr:hypothetical protein PISMIDRAFT_119245 [Pisolithus microcarpus 441]